MKLNFMINSNLFVLNPQTTSKNTVLHLNIFKPHKPILYTKLNSKSEIKTSIFKKSFLSTFSQKTWDFFFKKTIIFTKAKKN